MLVAALLAGCAGSAGADPGAASTATAVESWSAGASPTNTPSSSHSPSVSSSTSGAATSDAESPISRRSSSPAAGPDRSGAGAAGSPLGAPSSAPKRTPEVASSTLYQVVGVVDGDTLRVRVGSTTERVRVIGIDTPELKGSECYAQQAASRMQSLVQSKSVALETDPTQDDRDRYDRLLRHVKLADGRLVAGLLIEGGYGEEYTYDVAYRYRDQYVAYEKAARGARKGIWSSGCLDPGTAAPALSDKKTGGTGSGNAGNADSGSTGSSGCDIKGNISSKGEKIYHVPGGRWYGDTQISTGKGERWFCSESEARNAGWRAAKG